MDCDRFKNARILLFIYTHSHDGSGDLFFARRHSSVSVHDVSHLISPFQVGLLINFFQWWQNVIPVELKTLARDETNQLTIAVLACGAVITKERPCGELRDLAAE